MTRAKRGKRDPARPQRTKAPPELVEDLSEWEDETVPDGDDPFAAPEEPDEAGPDAVSDHAEHMELLEASGYTPTPAVAALIVMGFLIAAAGLVLGLAAWLEPAFRSIFAVAGAFALLAGAVMVWSILRGRQRFKDACEACHFDIRRAVSTDQAVFGDVLTTTLDTTHCQLSPSLIVSTRDHPAPGFEAGRKIILHGQDSITYQVKALRRGVQALDQVDVRMMDGGQVWRHTRSYRVPVHVEVAPGMSALQLRSMLTARAPFPDGAPKALVNLFRDIEHEQVRQYQGGDRMRDVDWKRMGMTGQMMVKDRIVESLNVGLLLIDAGTSMRLLDGGRRNLDLALEAASEIIEEAGRRNHQIGFLAFNDEEVIEEMPPSRSRTMPRDAQDRFQRVAARDVVADEPGKEPVIVSLNRALRKLAGSQMGVLLFSDLETIDEGIVQALSRLRGQGAKVGVILLPQPSLEAKRRAYRRYRTRPAAGKYRGKMHRRELRELLSIQGIETMELPS